MGFTNLYPQILILSDPQIVILSLAKDLLLFAEYAWTELRNESDGLNESVR